MTMTDTGAALLSASALQQSVVPAGEAAAAVLPSPEPLVPGVPQPASLVAVADWAAAGVARLDRVPGAMLGILVKQDLVDALAGAPTGALDVAAAVQPALDAAARALGATAGAGQTLVGDELAAAVTAATVALPMVAGSEVAAVLFVVAAEDQATTDFGTSATGLSHGGPAAAPAGDGANRSPRPATTTRGVELLHGVSMEVTVELGRTRLSVRELLALSPGDVLELDRAAGSPADLLVNGRLIARGEVVVVDEDFALRVTEIVAQSAG
ncbi:MAG TPA: flagellar motor switch protein FliN [Nocardioidaceae bacterium]